MASVRGASHVALDVTDLAASIAFYEVALGLDIFLDQRTDPQRPNIKGLIGGFAIELAQDAARPAPRDRVGGHGGVVASPCVSLAISNASSAFAQLKAAGHVQAAAITEVQGVKFFFVTDPDGHVFELIQFPQGLETLADLAPLLRPARA